MEGVRITRYIVVWKKGKKIGKKVAWELVNNNMLPFCLSNGSFWFRYKDNFGVSITFVPLSLQNGKDWWSQGKFFFSLFHFLLSFQNKGLYFSSPLIFLFLFFPPIIPFPNRSTRVKTKNNIKMNQLVHSEVQWSYLKSVISSKSEKKNRGFHGSPRMRYYVLYTQWYMVLSA